VVDTAAGSELNQRELPPPPRRVTLLTILHGWPDDAGRWLDSVLRHHATHDL